MNVGATRKRLAKLIEEVCTTPERTVKVDPSRVRPSTGAYRTNKMLDCFVWHATLTVTDHTLTPPFTYKRTLGSFDPMGKLLKHGFSLYIPERDLTCDWELLAFNLTVDGKWGCKLDDEARKKLNVVVPKGVRL